jgi:HEPN domain-containing protein
MTGTDQRPQQECCGASRGPDPHALAVAQAVQNAVYPDIVILFGSRAAGDHGEWSDIDLAVVGESGEAIAYNAARDYMSENPPRHDAQIFFFTEAEFAQLRLARQHVAGQADGHGIKMSDEKLNFRNDYEYDYPVHWPGTKEKLEATERNWVSFNESVDRNDWDQESTGLKAQQAVENGIKAMLSANNCGERITHSLGDTWNEYLRSYHDPRDTSLKESVEELLRYTTAENPDTPRQTINWLELYAVKYKYRGAPVRMAMWEWEELRVRVNEAVSGMIAKAHEISGTNDDDLFPEGKPWERRSEDQQ